MQKFSLTLSIELSHGASPTSETLFDLMEGALDQASKNPKTLFAQFSPETDQGKCWIMRAVYDDDLVYVSGAEQRIENGVILLINPISWSFSY